MALIHPRLLLKTQIRAQSREVSHVGIPVVPGGTSLLRADQRYLVLRALWVLGALQLFIHPVLGIIILYFPLSWLIPALRKWKLKSTLLSGRKI